MNVCLAQGWQTGQREWETQMDSCFDSWSWSGGEGWGQRRGQLLALGLELLSEAGGPRVYGYPWGGDWGHL